MSTEAALLAAVAAAPGDSLPRLVYADWLDEQGDPRAEMVRVMEELRHHPVWADEYQRLRPARNRLWASLDPAWLEAMGYQKVYRPLFTTMPEKREHRWRLAEEFIDIWHGGLKEGDGYTDAEIAEAETRIGVRLPEALREWYRLAGKRRDVWSAQDHLLELPALGQFSDAQDRLLSDGGDLVIRGENQWVTRWCIRRVDLGLPDPPVFVDGERLVADSVTAFALLVMALEAAVTNIWCYISLDRSDGVPHFAKHYQVAQLPRGYWVGDPEWWEGTDVLLVCDHNWGHASCRTEEAYSALVRLFGYSVDRLS